ncbi:hypothetical protein C2G38_2030739 [Gigaspora rosea]|uniref:Uncharacterized protein n=1 Tax=Gigaspora rosea TaxID=44941 RepID=A0A397VVK6_9GLOM|nr:hypothetical protein C2G38_2030739 [Gigaspora rosea]
MAKVIRKEITSKSTNVTPSILATEFMNNAKISSTISSTPANQVQPVSTRFMPNLEAIQNALKYNKKLYHPSALEFEKICSIMDAYETEGVVISKQFGIKDSKDPKEQAVLLGITSTIMPKLLTKYPDLLAVDSTGCCNCLNFPNTAFMVKLDKPCADALKEWFTKNLNDQWIIDRVFYQFRFVKRSGDQEEFDQRKATLLNAEKLQTAIGNLTLDATRIIISYF